MAGITAIVFPLFVILTSSPAAPQPLDLSFSGRAGQDGLPEGWDHYRFRKIKRHTIYRLFTDGGDNYVKAVSVSSASGLAHRLEGNAAARPILRWKWKIGKTLAEGDARRKSGDDYAARIYVLFKYEKEKAGLGKRIRFWFAKKMEGRYPPDTALAYIWANKLPKGAAIANAYTGREMMIALQSGDGKAGRWVSERVNIVSDYRKYFGSEPPPLEGIAIMTDSDNTGGRAEAWYADFILSAD